MEIADFIFFLIAIAAGYAGTALDWLPESCEQAIPALLMNLSYPAMILSVMNALDLELLMSTGLFVAGATLVITLFLYYVSGPATRKMASERRAQLRFQIGVGNVVYVSIPLLGAISGPDILYIAIIHSMTQDILIWLLYYPMTIKASRRGDLKKSYEWLKTPCMLAMLTAIGLKVLGLELPHVLSVTVDKLSSVSAPLALLYLGYLIRKHGMWRWLGDRTAIGYALLKTLLLPLLLLLPLYFLSDLKTAVILALLFGSPAPIMSIVWAGSFDGDLPLAVNSCISSTISYVILASAVSFLLLGLKAI